MDAEVTLRLLTAEVEHSALPGLMSFVRIPNRSPLYDSEWAENGLLDAAISCTEQWTASQGIAGLTWRVAREADWPPLVLVDIAGSTQKTVLVYGHLDKQPGLEGWLPFCGPTQPAVKDGKLYGRGAADDGFSLFATILAVKACQQQNVPHSRVVLLLETEEESGSLHLASYLSQLQLEVPDVVLCLDSNVLSYDRLWITESMRGALALDVKVELLRKGIHSADSGLIASSFRVFRTLLGRLEDHSTGEIRLSALHTSISPERYKAYSEVASVVGAEWLSAFPLTAAPLHTDTVQLLLNQAWRPALTLTGLGGLPHPQSAGNVLRASTSARLSLRLPPDLDADSALRIVSDTLTTSPPYGASVTISRTTKASGWVGRPLSSHLQEVASRASELFFSEKPLMAGAGGSVPALQALSTQFPLSEFLVTGVLGPHSNAHSPNESLDIAYFTRLSACLAHVFAALCGD